MLVKTVRRPGKRGTRKLLQRFGKRFVCVRYCYDPVKQKKYKTVELIIQEADWVPSLVSPTLKDFAQAPSTGRTNIVFTTQYRVPIFSTCWEGTRYYVA